METRSSSEKEPLAALAFKIMQDEGRKLTYLRIYSGRLTSGADIYNVTKGKKEKIARLLKMHANKRERIEQAGAGEIVAIVGLRIRRRVIPSATKPTRFFWSPSNSMNRS